MAKRFSAVTVLLLAVSLLLAQEAPRLTATTIRPTMAHETRLRWLAWTWSVRTG